MKNHWHFIINPVSGKGKGLELWHKVQSLLDSHKLSYSFNISNYHKHTVKLVAEKHALGLRNFIGIGGDGTINEMINAIFNTQKNGIDDLSTLSLLPVGTGNDWVKNHDEILMVENLIARLKVKDAQLYDVGIVKLMNPTIWHYFLNVAGAGLDGKVVQELYKQGGSGRKGKLDYLLSLVKSLFNFVAPESVVSVEGKNIFSGKLLLVAAAKGQFLGGGMHLSPEALPNNGIFDITIVKQEALLKVFSQLYKLFNGKIATASFVEKHKGKILKVEFSEPTPVQADGEFIGEAKAIEFAVLENGVWVL